MVSLQYGVAQSLNTVAVRTILKLGLDKSYQFMTENMGITTLTEEDRSATGALALGGLSRGVTTEEMAAAFASFANGGIYNSPRLYTRVTDADGNVILENETETHVAMKESTAYFMNQLLQGAVRSGTGASANFGNMAIAGKTGTTSANYDRYFAGYTPYYAAAVWTGYKNNERISYSGNPALTLWRKVMSQVHEGLEYKSFPKASGLTSVTVCMDSGLLATDACRADARGRELLELAEAHNVQYFFEASVGGGIPLLHPLVNCLGANEIQEVYGILNGTTNYILTQMTENGESFGTALKAAQEKGYAEADPTADVAGIDAGRKTCILADLAFGRETPPEKVPMEGITTLDLRDVAIARQAGFRVKLLGRTLRLPDGGYAAYVAPHLIPEGKPIAHVSGVFNAAVIRGSAVGALCLVAACAAFCAGMRYDLFGIERRIPDQNEIAQLEIYLARNTYYLTPEDQPELLSGAQDLQRTLIAQKDLIRSNYETYRHGGSSSDILTAAGTMQGAETYRHGGSSSDPDASTNIRYIYTLKNGATVERFYTVSFARSDLQTSGSYANVMDSFVNSPALRQARLRWGDPEFHVESGSFDSQSTGDYFNLGTQECETLLSAIARDAENGNWGRYDWFEDDGTAYAMDLSFDFYRDLIDEHGTHYRSYDSIYITVRPEMTETKQALLDLNLATEQDFVTWQELNGITTEA